MFDLPKMLLSLAAIATTIIGVVLLVLQTPSAEPDAFGASQSLAAAGNTLSFREEIRVLNPAGCRPNPAHQHFEMELLSADRCPYCQDLKERVLDREGIIRDYCSDVMFTEVNIDPSDPDDSAPGDYRDFYNVSAEGIPQTGLYRVGKERFRFSGVPDAASLRRALDQMLANQ